MDVSDKMLFFKGIRHGSAFHIDNAAFEKLLTAIPSKE
jgi:hypothetical protein